MARGTWAALLLAGLAMGVLGEDAPAPKVLKIEGYEVEEGDFPAPHELEMDEDQEEDPTSRTFTVTIKPAPETVLPEAELFAEQNYEEGEGKAAREAMAAQVDEKKVMEEFDAIDKDGSGLLEAAEVEQWMKENEFSRSFNWRFFDLDNDDKINLMELIRWAKLGGVGGEGLDAESGAEDVTDIVAQIRKSGMQLADSVADAADAIEA